MSPTLPGRQATETPSATASRSVPILVIDDNAAKRLALRAVLLPLGYSIVEADSGLAALRCVMAQEFAVILLDVRMPIMGGFETAALIRLRRQSEMTPIIFITAHGTDEIVSDPYVEGAVDFLFAPIQPDELRAKVAFFANLFLRAETLAARARDVQASADQLRRLTDAAPIGIFQTDAANRYVYTNPRWTEITGISADDALGRQWDAIIRPGQRAGLSGEMAVGAMPTEELTHRFEIRGPDEAPRIALLTSRAMLDIGGGIAGWVGTLADITAEAGAEAAMSAARDEATKASQRDALTGLGNRRALQQDLELLEARVTRYGHRYCMALIDVDLFKSYNDSYGHQAGDDALRAVAAQLKSAARSGDAIYRYGGDEFLCIFPEQSMSSGVQAVERMRDGVERLAVTHADNPRGVLTVSGGLAMLDPARTRPASAVLKESDESLYRAKQLGRNRVEQVAAVELVEQTV